MADANTTREEIDAIKQAFEEIINTLNEATNVGQNTKLFGMQHMVFFDNKNKIRTHWEDEQEICNYVAIEFNSSTPQSAKDLISQLAKDSGFTVVITNKTLSIEVNRGETFHASYNLENATNLLELVRQNKQKFSQLAISQAIEGILNSPAAKSLNPEQLAELLGKSIAAAAEPAAAVPTAKDLEIQ